MEITKELLSKRIEEINKDVESFKQGYSQALGWVVAVLEAKPTEANDTAK